MNTIFWYESNACWGWVKSIDDLKEKLRLQTQPFYGALKDKDEFLDKSFQHSDGGPNFGTRREYTGDKTLRQFLIEHGFDLNLL